MAEHWAEIRKEWPTRLAVYDQWLGDCDFERLSHELDLEGMIEVWAAEAAALESARLLGVADRKIQRVQELKRFKATVEAITSKKEDGHA